MSHLTDKYTEDYKTTFRAGWARGMKSAGAGDTNAGWSKAIEEAHTKAYHDGWVAAVDHFNGFNTHGTDLAHDLGLWAQYVGYYGQSDWEHPLVLPGHNG